VKKWYSLGGTIAIAAAVKSACNILQHSRKIQEHEAPKYLSDHPRNADFLGYKTDIEKMVVIKKCSCWPPLLIVKYN